MKNVICGRCVKCGKEYEAVPNLTNCPCGVSGFIYMVVCAAAFLCARWVNLPALLGSLFVR